MLMWNWRSKSHWSRGMATPCLLSLKLCVVRHVRPMRRPCPSLRLIEQKVESGGKFSCCQISVSLITFSRVIWARLKSDADFREEMNLIYVAMTRACESNDYPPDLNNWLLRQKGMVDDRNSSIRSPQTKPTPMKNTAWVIIDTETDGLLDPIHVVEIAAQRMNGWDPVGEKFRVLLNHGVPIPPEATAVHGYTTEFLRQQGEDPLVAHARFREFVGVLPLVAHNLSFDWNRALFQEWLRLGLEPAGQRGFCTLMLSRRLVDECKVTD